MAEFDAAIALLGLVDPKDEKSSDSDSASGNDQDKTENKQQNNERGNNKSSHTEKVKTVKTGRSKPEASDSGTTKMGSIRETDDRKEQDGSGNGSGHVAEQNASGSTVDQSQSHSKPSESSSQQEEQTPRKSSQSPSSDWDGLPQEKNFQSPRYPQQPDQQSGLYQHQQVPASQQQQQQSSFNHSPQHQQQQHLPLPQPQYQYSAQQQTPAQSQQSQPESPPQYSQSPAYSTQQSSANPPPRLPPISQISQPPTPSPHQPYQEHNSRSGYQDHATYSPYQQHASGSRPLSYQQSEQHPTGYPSASQHGQPIYAQGAQSGPGSHHPNMSGRPSSYFSYRDINEQYSAIGVPGSAPTSQNGYQQYSAPIDPALGGHGVPPVQPEPEGYAKEGYYQPPIQPNGVPPAQRRATSAASNPPGALNSSVWNAIASSGGESISNATSALYINARNHTHASFATDDFLEATICSSILE
ncbi:hypothetical protein V1525DRAFT_339581 [Lipomyces kononenkoae]|uniref:Uncharacterized protein n=1 Tax=Lipomyces kononenkoae TaxID=34357 RepID=A0ACC3T642_LIPKO